MSKDKKKSKKANPFPAVVFTSEEGLRGGLNRLVRLQLEVAAADAEHQGEIAKLNEKHAKRAGTKCEEISVLETSIALYCKLNRPTLFPEGDTKSKEYENATVGFRYDPHSVALVIEKDTAEQAAQRILTAVEQRDSERAAAVMSGGPVPEPEDWLEEFVILKPTIDKKRLLARRSQLTPAEIARLRELGIEFKQDEQFFIEPKADAATRLTQPAAETAPHIAA